MNKMPFVRAFAAKALLMRRGIGLNRLREGYLLQGSENDFQEIELVVPTMYMDVSGNVLVI